MKKIYIVSEGIDYNYDIDKIFESLEDSIDYILSIEPEPGDHFFGGHRRIETSYINEAKGKKNKELFYIRINFGTYDILDIFKISEESFIRESNWFLPIEYYEFNGNKEIIIRCFADNEQNAIDLAMSKVKIVKDKNTWQ